MVTKVNRYMYVKNIDLYMYTNLSVCNIKLEWGNQNSHLTITKIAKFSVTSIVRIFHIELFVIYIIFLNRYIKIRNTHILLQYQEH